MTALTLAANAVEESTDRLGKSLKLFDQIMTWPEEQESTFAEKLAKLMEECATNFGDHADIMF